MQRVAFGGPWYGSKVDTRLCLSLLQFVTLGPRFGLVPEEVVIGDGMLDLTRNELMVKALRSGCDWFLSADADCSFIGQIPELGVTLRQFDIPEVALVGAPVRCGLNDRWNVTFEGGFDTTLERPLLAGKVKQIGFGLVAFRLAWYREHWPKLDSLHVPFFQTKVMQDGSGGFKSLSEDYNHCAVVRAVGGHVVCDPRIVVKHHVVRAGHPLAANE